MSIRQKPWETSSIQQDTAGNGELVQQNQPPPRPQEPVLLNDPASQDFNNNLNYAQTSQFGPSFGGGYGQYSTPGLSSFGSYGGYGGMGYGGMGYGGMGYNQFNSFNSRFGAQGMPSSLQNSTMATFQLIESMVGAFGGFAQMLESTYMATHSSFFAMMSVADQVGRLKQSLGSILGIFAVLRFWRKLLAKIRGTKVVENSKSLGLTSSNFAKFKTQAPQPARPNLKPLLVFLTVVFGFPYLLAKLIKNVAEQNGGEIEECDPSKLQFCRAMYDFVPENPNIEVELKRGDLAAILSSKNAQGGESSWWRVRTRDGRIGYAPGTYLQVIERPKIPEVNETK